VERILTQEHCAHRLRKQASVVNPANKEMFLDQGEEKKTNSPKRGGAGQMTVTRPVAKTGTLKKR